jgi:hypothetical protein
MEMELWEFQQPVRNFIGAMSGDTTKGIFVTTTDFDENAIKKAKEAHHKIILINGIRLVDLMYKYGVGVQTKSIYEVKAIDSDFFEIVFFLGHSLHFSKDIVDTFTSAQTFLDHLGS